MRLPCYIFNLFIISMRSNNSFHNITPPPLLLRTHDSELVVTRRLRRGAWKPAGIWGQAQKLSRARLYYRVEVVVYSSARGWRKLYYVNCASLPLLHPKVMQCWKHGSYDPNRLLLVKYTAKRGCVHTRVPLNPLAAS